MNAAAYLFICANQNANNILACRELPTTTDDFLRQSPTIADDQRRPTTTTGARESEDGWSENIIFCSTRISYLRFIIRITYGLHSFKSNAFARIPSSLPPPPPSIHHSFILQVSLPAGSVFPHEENENQQKSQSNHHQLICIQSSAPSKQASKARRLVVAFGGRCRIFAGVSAVSSQSNTCRSCKAS